MSAIQENNNPKKIVYTIIEREDAHNIWMKIGVGWVNRDGSLNIKLNALPLNNMLQIRDAEKEPEQKQ